MTARKAAPLRVVKSDEKPRRPRAPRKVVHKTVAEAAAAGDRRQMLVLIQKRIARDIDKDSTTAVALAALTQRILAISTEIAALDAASKPKGDPISGALDTPDEAFTP